MPKQSSKTGGKYVAVAVRPDLSWFAPTVGSPDFARTVPAISGGDVTTLVEVASAFWAGAGNAVTVLYGAKNEEADIDGALAVMRERGFTVDEGGAPHGWWTFRKQSAGTVHLGVESRWGKDAPALLTDGDAKTIVTRLARFAELTGTVWRGKNAGLAGGDLLMRTTARGALRLSWNGAPKRVIGSAKAFTDSWAVRELTEAERGMRYVHRFDVRLMYLAAFNAVEVGAMPPEFSPGKQLFDRRRHGYWQIDTRDVEAADREHRERTGRGIVPMTALLTGPRPVRNRAWITTPVAALMEDLGIPVTVLDAWLSPEGDSVRPFRAWSEILRDAVRAAELDDKDKILRASIKDVANRYRGLLASEGGSYRPDIADAVVGRANATLIRKLVTAGADPVLYRTDAVWIVSNDVAGVVATELKAAPTWQLGALVHEETMTVEDYLGGAR